MIKNNPTISCNSETDVLNSWSEMKREFKKMKQDLQSGAQNETKVTFRDFKYHTENPFITDVIEQITENKKYRKAIGHKYQQVLNEDTGELENQKVLVLGEQKRVDKQEYYKVYRGAIKNFFSLSNNTMKLFEYIMTSISYSHDRICILPSDVLEKIDISRTGCYRAILQLLETNIIAKADREGCYFINPTIAFKGDRITLMKQYILNKEKDKKSSPGKLIDCPKK